MKSYILVALFANCSAIQLDPDYTQSAGIREDPDDPIKHVL